MRHHELFSRLDIILEEIKRLDEENPTGPDEETDPRIVALIDEGERICLELDPFMRETYRHNPVKLAEWDEIMHMNDDLPEDAPAKPNPSNTDDAFKRALNLFNKSS